jgi:hypothetical protein
MRGPTRGFWVNLTPFSLQLRARYQRPPPLPAAVLISVAQLAVASPTADPELLER